MTVCDCASRAYSLIADVVTIEKTGEFFRLIYDVKGRYSVHRIQKEEASVSMYIHVCVLEPLVIVISLLGCF